MTYVYFIRHAQSTANVNGYCYGISECDVTEYGKEQLERLSQRFKDIHIDIIYTSPMKRTLATAKAVNKYHGVPIVEEKGLIEINAGEWEMKRWADLEKMFPEEFETWKSRPHLWSSVGSETMAEVYIRMQKTVEDIVRANKNKTVVIVSHACALSNYFCMAKGLPHDSLIEVKLMSNTGVSLVEYDDDLNLRIVYENDTRHLGDD
jgi:broad specificity phosphatase PhoE